MTTRDQYQKTAEEMTGRRLLLRFRQPPSQNTAGEVYRPDDAPGLLLIDIDPQYTGRERLRIFLHEVSHIILGHADVMRTTPAAHELSGARPAEFSAGQSALGIALAAGIIAKQETEAETLGAELLKWAEERIKDHVAPGDPWAWREAAILTALTFWKDTL